MDPSGDSPAQAALAWQRAVGARARAERAFGLARRYEGLARSARDPMFERLAHIHRTTGARHQVAAELLESHARRASRWVRDGGPPPRFMTGVAEACGAHSVAVTLVDGDRNQLATAPSDQPARRAQDLEFALGEGPARDAVRARAPIDVSGRALSVCWPGYGPAVMALGIGQVVAVPLQAPDECIGALAVFDPHPGTASTLLFSQVADALTRSVLLGRDAVPGLFGGIDFRAVVHQAAGVTAVQLGCSVVDALELVKARAFADGRPIGDIARDIVEGRLTLG
ncbi:GAF and ANTAR domain-containing protein [Streptomyces sp. VRA16 Mangrove soil]|uniref:GAF and ANTAR domain-containing protein n=1 Tax=Streptomyces sp. VRA16 Mangrove soil TaxID=2817434 RepID=UPI001A9FF8F8|nr:GAF and ANTAR domain-containing protein [Streptomyces sp. VRA16 Mangrove soil]MBO1333285.1 GAF and ANTAR domain-containing protein [Streptomyces sp. VRA16 Mangrove soil]